jgi:hemoglobin
MSDEKSPSLYDRIGGEATIAGAIDLFYDRVLEDPELHPFFRESSIEKLRRMQREFFAAALGGPQRYTGLSLAQAHGHRGISERHFQLFIRHLLETLDELGLPPGERTEVIDRITLHRDAITGGPAQVPDPMPPAGASSQGPDEAS